MGCPVHSIGLTSQRTSAPAKANTTFHCLFSYAYMSIIVVTSLRTPDECASSSTLHVFSACLLQYTLMIAADASWHQELNNLHCMSSNLAINQRLSQHVQVMEADCGGIHCFCTHLAGSSHRTRTDVNDDEDDVQVMTPGLLHS